MLRADEQLALEEIGSSETAIANKLQEEKIEAHLKFLLSLLASQVKDLTKVVKALLKIDVKQQEKIDEINDTLLQWG